jgi:hypothetical protein
MRAEVIAQLVACFFHFGIEDASYLSQNRKVNGFSASLISIAKTYQGHASTTSSADFRLDFQVSNESTSTLFDALNNPSLRHVLLQQDELA